ncbi:hypothetical protein ACXJJ3_08685 [Kribbella sp. WER1]
MRALDALYQLIAPIPNAVRLRTAKVEGFTSSSATINLAGGSVSGVSYLASYAPAVGHTVLVAQTNAGVLVILGRAAP